MAKRPIRIWPDPALSEVARPVDAVDDSVRQLVADLFETMYHERGIGLAATQVADPRQVLVVDLDPDGQAKRQPEVRAELDSWGFRGPVALINPEIVQSSGDIVWEEGCLSVPGVVDNVKRRAHILVRALDAAGVVQEFEAHGLFAVAIQHEMDHLQGRVFVQYLSRLRREVIRRKMLRLQPAAPARRTAVR